MADWYYSIAGERHGPVTSAQLRDLVVRESLAPDDLVWREGMIEWAAARRVNGLFPDIVSAIMPSPPPIPVRVSHVPYPPAHAAYENPYAYGSVHAPPQPQLHLHYQAPPQVGTEQAYSGAAMAGLIIGTLLIPLIGIIVGIIAMNHPARKSQGIALLCVGLFMVLAYIISSTNG